MEKVAAGLEKFEKPWCKIKVVVEKNVPKLSCVTHTESVQLNPNQMGRFSDETFGCVDSLTRLYS
jgi:hypothetical protein